MSLRFFAVLLSLSLLFSACKDKGIHYDFRSYDVYKPGVVENAPESIAAVKKFEAIENPSLEFYAVGCAGSANEGQRMLGQSMAKIASVDKPDLVLYLGDNFYGRGVGSIDDPKWKSAFEDIFDPEILSMPFYAVLGNHDHYKNAQAQVDYSKKSARWRMPAYYYSFERKLEDGTLIEFFGLDTENLNDKTQLEWLDKSLAKSKGDWKIVYGHHPVYSSAVTYAKQTEKTRQILESIFIRNKVNLYISAHNHSIEVLKEHSGIHYVVSGAGSRPRSVRWTEETKFAHADIGFAWFRIHGSTMEMNIVGKDGLILFSDQYSKNDPA